MPLKQINEEVKIVLPVVDTISLGWLTTNDTTNVVDRFPVIFYHTNRPISKKQLKQFYSFLVIRLSRDTVVLIEKINGQSYKFKILFETCRRCGKYKTTQD